MVINWDDPSCSRPPQCRPRLLGVRNSDHILLDSLFINDSIFWTLHIVNSSHVALSDLLIRGDPGIPNNDGIDIDSSEHVSVDGIDVDTADDALCIKTTERGRRTAHVDVRGATLASRSAALKFGSESVADMHNVTIRDVVVRALLVPHLIPSGSHSRSAGMNLQACALGPLRRRLPANHCHAMTPM